MSSPIIILLSGAKTSGALGHKQTFSMPRILSLECLKSRVKRPLENAISNIIILNVCSHRTAGAGAE